MKARSSSGNSCSTPKTSARTPTARRLSISGIAAIARCAWLALASLSGKRLLPLVPVGDEDGLAVACRFREHERPGERDVLEPVLLLRVEPGTAGQLEPGAVGGEERHARARGAERR